MYCPNCSNEVKPELNYCNSCGYKIEGASKDNSGQIAKSLSQAIGWIGVVGLVTFVFVIKLLLENDVLQGALIAIAFLYLAALFGICYSIVGFIKSIHSVKSQKQEVQFEQTREISGRSTGKLEAAHTPPASVTEHTTRTLEKIPADSEY